MPVPTSASMAAQDGPPRPAQGSGALERMGALMAALGNPHLAYPVVHVTGTNGKTSTARMVGALLGAQGLSVGVTTSPHLASHLERMTVGGEAVSEEAFAHLAARVAAAGGGRDGGARAGYFETITAAALTWFAECHVEVAVVEVGIGGRQDATNVVGSDVAVITNVSLDHVELLGPTRADIARDKAGIVKAGSTLVLGERDPELAQIFDSTPARRVWRLGEELACEANLAIPQGRLLDLRTPGARYEQVTLALHGAHQAINAACGLAAAEALLGAPLGEAAVRAALGGITSPGRLEVMGERPWLVLDGAKNPAGAAAAAAAIDEELAQVVSRILVVGMLDGRDPLEMLKALGAAKARLVVACAPGDPRALAPEAVAEAAAALGVAVVVAASVARAVDVARTEAAAQDLVLVSGSLYVVGEAREHLMRGGAGSGDAGTWREHPA